MLLLEEDQKLLRFWERDSMTKKWVFLLFSCLSSILFCFNAANAQSSQEFSQEVWESEYSALRENVSSIEITQYNGKNEETGLERIHFDNQKNQIISESIESKNISSWVEQYDSQNRLLSKVWSFQRENYEDTNAPSASNEKSPKPIWASNKYGMKFIYAKNNYFPTKVVYFDEKYGNIAMDNVVKLKNKIIIQKNFYIRLYIMSKFDLYLKKQIEFDQFGRRILENTTRTSQRPTLNNKPEEAYEIENLKYSYSEKSKKLISILSFKKEPNAQESVNIEYYFDTSGFLFSTKIYSETPKNCRINEKGVYNKYDFIHKIDNKMNWTSRTVMYHDCKLSYVAGRSERKIIYKK
jgi:hypothetical protein